MYVWKTICKKTKERELVEKMIDTSSDDIMINNYQMARTFISANVIQKANGVKAITKLRKDLLETRNQIKDLEQGSSDLTEKIENVSDAEVRKLESELQDNEEKLLQMNREKGRDAAYLEDHKKNLK